MPTFEGAFKLRFEWKYSDAHGFVAPVDNAQLYASKAIADGDDIDEANLMWADRRVISAASGTDDIDLSGTLEDQFGNAAKFAKIKGLMIWNRGYLEADGETFNEGSGQDLLVGGAGAGGNAWGELFDGDQDAVVPVKSGGVLVLTAPHDGIAVTPGTSDILRITWDGNVASGFEIRYDIVIIGVAA